LWTPGPALDYDPGFAGVTGFKTFYRTINYSTQRKISAEDLHMTNRFILLLCIALMAAALISCGGAGGEEGQVFQQGQTMIEVAS
jgi:hypothetical protein